MEQTCKNCEKPLVEGAKYCAFCGEKTKSPKVTVKALMQKLWDTTFHIDNKLFRALKDAFKPGTMALNYFAGKRSRYPHPIRLYLISAFLLLFLLDKLTKSKPDRSIVRFNLEEQNHADSLASRDFYGLMRNMASMEDFRSVYVHVDTSAEAAIVFDSALARYTRQFLDSELLFTITQDSLGRPDSTTINLLFEAVRVRTTDLARYNPDVLIERYHIQNHFEQIVFRQGIKAIEHPQALGNAFLGSISWVLLTIIAVMSAILTLLYRKQNRYYVEHFVFQLYSHAGMAFGFSVWFATMLMVELPVWVNSLFLLSVLAARFAGMKRFYGETAGKTLWKWTVYEATYILATAVLFTIGTLLVFILY